MEKQQLNNLVDEVQPITTKNKRSISFLKMLDWLAFLSEWFASAKPLYKKHFNEEK